MSRSVNSEYSNKPYSEKRARFLEKNRVVTDSLKMTLIYEKNVSWNDALAKLHQEDMLECFKVYFKNVKTQVGRIKS